MDSKILKEISIILLLVIIIIFAFAVLFYDCISSDNQEIVSIQYVAEDEVDEVLQEVQKNSELEQEHLIKTYSVDKNDLAVYASGQYYESGKKDPFEALNTEDETKDEQNVEKNTENEIKNEQNVEKNTQNEIKNEQNVENNIAENEKIANKNETKEENIVENTVTEGKFFEKKNSK